MHALARDTGLTVLWATHLTDEVLPGDHLVLLHQGRVLASGTASALHGTTPLRDWFLSRTAVPA